MALTHCRRLLRISHSHISLTGQGIDQLAENCVNWLKLFSKSDEKTRHRGRVFQCSQVCENQASAGSGVLSISGAFSSELLADLPLLRVNR